MEQRLLRLKSKVKEIIVKKMIRSDGTLECADFRQIGRH